MKRHNLLLLHFHYYIPLQNSKTLVRDRGKAQLLVLVDCCRMVPINWLFKEPTSPSSWPWHRANKCHVKQLSASVSFDRSIPRFATAGPESAACDAAAAATPAWYQSVNSHDKSVRMQNKNDLIQKLRICCRKMMKHDNPRDSTMPLAPPQYLSGVNEIQRSQRRNGYAQPVIIHKDGSQLSHITAASASSSLENSCWLAACWSSTWERFDPELDIARTSRFTSTLPSRPHRRNFVADFAAPALPGVACCAKAPIPDAETGMHRNALDTLEDTTHADTTTYDHFSKPKSVWKTYRAQGRMRLNEYAICIHLHCSAASSRFPSLPLGKRSSTRKLHKALRNKTT